MLQIQAKTSGKRLQANLCIGSRGVSDVGGGGLPIAAEALHKLGGVAVKVVADVCERDLTTVQVLEGRIHGLHGCLKRLTLLLTTHTRPACADLLVSKEYALHDQDYST